MSENILTATQICKTFSDPITDEVVQALVNIDVAVKAHEFVSIVGPSGCGKSTFLRIVAGLDRQTTGDISVAGKRVNGPGADRGMVFQDYALFPWKTIQRNVEFGLLLKNVEKTQRQTVAKRFIDLVGLNGFENKYPHHLSGGMKQRAAVARAMANSPAILLMDEPFAAVDTMTRQRLQEELTQISAKEKTTVLFVTHSIEEAIFLSDRVIVFSGRPGKIIANVPIELERPRDWKSLSRNQKFVGYCENLTNMIHNDNLPGHAS